MAAFDLVAGAVGFTYTWQPAPSTMSATYLSSLTGYTVTMIVVNETTGYRATFPMTVSSDGLSASYKTVASTDFPTGGAYSIAFQVSGNGQLLETPPVTRYVAPAL